ncbi:LacI family DNA-binding transcriptional regulator [Gellertiella hungarica]|uniref:LacI family transcriptional regulator n=1 Tax=Gellertiella hungarica TaxID=1572859 RepID=A0A7W6J501_9HYPH|nr:LacI family DNA-binding transcriptional regulator [Gellertiella hungarica]MBB4064909.1 LacI family transcriptional regulator [Gellertiella hungarica]
MTTNADESRPTIKTIAFETGLSIATVSKALKDSPQVRPETRDLVQEAARRIGYQRNLHGVRLRTGKTYQVAAIMTAPGSRQDEWEGVEYAQLLSGISFALEGTPYRIVPYTVRDFAESQEMVRQIAEQRKADGIIISGIRCDDPRIRTLQQAKMPFVAYGVGLSNAPHASVDTDNDWVMRDAIERLSARGHRRIALLNPLREYSWGMTRLVAYRNALAERGLPFSDAFVAEGRLTPAFGREAVLGMCREASRPTAFIAANEAAALGAVSALHEIGLVPGRDAVVIATDDLNVSRYFVPPITTYYLPISEPSTMLGQFILRRMAGEPVDRLQALLRPTLIERNDDACPEAGAAQA